MTKSDVHSDFDWIRQKAGIEEWAAKFVTRKYAFEDPTVEKGESEWMKVVYGFDQPELPMDTTGPTFSHVFGANTSAFELLVVKRKIMGPCWLELKNVALSTKSVSLARKLRLTERRRGARLNSTSLTLSMSTHLERGMQVYRRTSRR